MSCDRSVIAHNKLNLIDSTRLRLSTLTYSMSRRSVVTTEEAIRQQAVMENMEHALEILQERSVF